MPPAIALAGRSHDKLLAVRDTLRELISADASQPSTLNAIAARTQAVHSCGFDSIPSDLSVFALHRRVSEDQAGELGDTNVVVRSFAGGVSGAPLHR